MNRQVAQNCHLVEVTKTLTLPPYARCFQCKHIPGDADVQDRGREKFTDSRVLDSFAALSSPEQLLIAYILMANIYTYGISYSKGVMLLSVLYSLSHLTLISKI